VARYPAFAGVKPFGRPPRRNSKPLTARQIRAALGLPEPTAKDARRLLDVLPRRCGLCRRKRDLAHGCVWVTGGKCATATRHAYRYNDSDRPTGRSLCGLSLPRGTRCYGGLHGGTRNCRACLRAGGAR